MIDFHNRKIKIFRYGEGWVKSSGKKPRIPPRQLYFIAIPVFRPLFNSLKRITKHTAYICLFKFIALVLMSNF